MSGSLTTHLCDSQVQRVIPAVGVHLLSQQAVGLHHHQRVAGLHAEQEVVVVQGTADVGKLEGALHHTARCVTIVAEDTSRQAAVVGADAHGSVQPLALVDQGLKYLHTASKALSGRFEKDC